MNLEQLIVLILILLITGIGLAALTLLCDVILMRFVRRARAAISQLPPARMGLRASCVCSAS
ncbi:MAG: hypothetical protein DCC52_19565 [Chloroflexi bacterium]|nr:MAG: hypothetical protein DCC52_19565 [Chloroflexota bacterium]